MGDGEQGWYVYGVTAAEDRPAPGPLGGVDPELDGVDTVTHGAVTALTSRVRLSEFGGPALDRNLQDVAWVSRTARIHDAVIGRVATSATVVPMRLCTIFVDRHHVTAMLRDEQPRLVAELERLRGHAEWSVKVLVDPAAVQAALPGAGPGGTDTTGSGGAAPGRAYLARKSRQRQLEDAARRHAVSVAETVHEHLRALAAAATVLPLQHPELSGRAGRMVLNGAYLVDRAREASFAAAVGDLRRAHGPDGFEVEMSGPWAPYNFVAGAEARA